MNESVQSGEISNKLRIFDSLQEGDPVQETVSRLPAMCTLSEPKMADPPVGLNLAIVW